MKPKITIIIVLSLLITLPSIAFAEKIQPEDEIIAPQKQVSHPHIIPAKKEKRDVVDDGLDSEILPVEMEKSEKSDLNITPTVMQPIKVFGSKDTLLLNESFEHLGSLPPDWYFISTGTNGFQINSSTYYDGIYSLWHDDDYGMSSSWAITPTITISDTATVAEFSFWQYQKFPSYYILHEVLISTDYASDTTATWVSLYEGVGIDYTWEQKVFDILSYAGNDVTFAFHYIGDFADEWFIDLVQLNVSYEPIETMDWCNTQWPHTMSVPGGSTSETVYGQCWEPGLTDLPGPGAGITAQLGYGNSNTTPGGTWSWVNAVYNLDVGDNDEYMATFDVPLDRVGDTLWYCYRYAINDGPWVYGGIGGIYNNDPGLCYVTGDIYEPNNTLADATPIASGDSLQGPTIDPGGDIDLYVFTGTAGYIVRAETCPVSGVTMDTKLYLLDADSTQLAYDDDSGEDHLSLITGYELPADGIYYLKATGYSSYTTGFYNMKLDLLPPSSYSGVIIVNEIMQNPSAVGDSYGEYLELYNAGDTDVDIEGWTLADLEYDSFVIHGDTTGTGYTGGGGNTLIPAGGYLVLSPCADTLINGRVPVDYEYTTDYGALDEFDLANGSDEVLLYDTGGLLVDKVCYDNGATFPDPTGKSMELIDPALDNSLGVNWQEAWTIYGDGDYGTPGAVNSTEPVYIPDAYEPNNASLEAAYIPPGTYDLSLSATQDEYDWFYCPVNAGDTVNVQISFDDTQCDFDLDIYDKDGNLLDWSWTFTSPEEVEYVFLANDTLYICAIGYDGEGPYTMAFTIKSPPITSPWVEGFENYNYGDIPPRWLVFNDDANASQWGVSVTGGYESYQCMKVGWNAAGNDDWLVTPPMIITDGDIFSFMTATVSSYYVPETFEVWISTANEITSSADFTIRLDSLDISSTDYWRYSKDLSAYTGQKIYIAVRNISIDMMGQLVDDVSLSQSGAKIALSDTTHDFGLIEEGTTATFGVGIHNYGASDLIVDGATVAPPFYCNFTDTIPPGEISTATIEFSPIASGFYAETLIFNSNAEEGTNTIDLTGIAYGSDYVTEGFEDIEFPPFGWQNPGRWKRYTNDPYVGEAYARIGWYHDQDASLITPRLIIESGDIISFWWRNANMYDGKGGGKVIGADTLFVEISNTYNDPTPIWEELAVLSPEEEMLVYENVVLPIPDTYIGDDAKIRFRHRSELNAESRGVGLDEVILPPLNTPVNFYLDPYTQSDYDSIGATVAYDIDIYNTGIQTDRYYISLAGSKTRRDVLIDEGFEGATFPPAGWTEINHGTATGWFQDYYGSGSYEPPGGTGAYFANCDSDANGPGVWSSLFTPSLDLSGGTASIEFVYNMQDYAGDGYAELNVYSGGTGADNFEEQLWTETEDNSGFLSFSFDPSGYANPSDVYIEFMYDDENAWAWNFAIDDVIIEGTGGGGPPTPPEGWPVTFSDPYIDVEPGEMGTFTAYVEIPDDVQEDDVNTSTIYVESREDPLINHEADVVTTAHPKDPCEPNNTFADATPFAYGDITEDAQIYYDPNYADFDVDIYKFDGSEGDVVYIVFDVADTLLFDGAIALLDADSTLLASADDGFGGDDENLQYRLLNDGTFYVMLGHWSHVLTGPFKKELERTETTTYYTASLELIPSPGVLVEPEELTLGITQGKNTVSDILYITNTGDEGAINLDWDIEIVIPGIDIFLDEEFGHFPPDGWTAEDNWVGSNSANAGGTAPEAEFSWYPSFTGIRRLISPVINTEGYTSLPMTFKHYVNDYSGGYTVGVATTSDGGTTWNDVWTISPTANVGPETVSLTIDNADVGSDNFQVCWYFDGYSYNINYWYIDDVYMATGEAWVVADPVSGSVPQKQTRTSTITCDDTTLEPGVYTADIIVHNNALLYGASDVTVPLTLNVGEAAGGLQGTVTFITTGEPIDSVEVTCGGFVAYTDSNGFYQFDPVPPIGTYNILYHKDGFLDHWEHDIVLGQWTTVLDVQMYFDGPRPRDLVAEGQHLCIDLTWHAPELGGGGEEYDIIYDDGVAENATAWFDGGNMNAVRFTPLGYPCTITKAYMNVYDGTWPSGANLQPFEVAVFDDDGPGGLPNTELGRVTVTPTHYDFIEVDLSSLNISIDSGDFYIAHIQGGDYPNCLPTAIDETVPTVNRSYSRYITGGGNWELSSYQDFMIRATVIGPRGVDLLPENGETVTFSSDVMSREMFVNGSSPRIFEHYVNPKTGSEPVGNGLFPRDLVLVGYNVYREDVTTGPIAYIPVEDPRYYRDKIVEVGIEYTYWVTAVYTVGESGPSNLASATPIFLNIENFELDDGGYTSNDPSGWQWGHATAGPPSAHSGENLWGTVLNGNYIDNASWTLDAPEIDITSANCLLMFYHWYNTENSWDGGNVKISTDGGTTWTVIIPEGGYPDDSIVGLGNEPGYTANSGGWVVAVFDLADYIGETVQLRWHFGTDSSVHGYPGWYIDSVILGINPNPPEYGALQGTVTDGWGNGIGDAIITAIGNLHPLERYCVTTNEDGYYEIDPIIAQFYNFTCEAEGYLTFTDTFTVLPGETYVEDVVMGNPLIRVEPDSHVVTLAPADTTTRVITVYNDGNAPLEWSSSIEQLGVDLLTNRFEGVTAPSMNAEVDPNQTTPYNPPSKDIWDILFAYDVDGPSGLTGLVSAESDGDYLYTTKWSGSGEIAKFDLEGNYIETFYISGVTNLRDLAYDGTYFYGSDASSYIWQMDFDTQTLVSTIPCPVAVRSIAYDEDNDAFWVNNWSEDLKLVDRSGNVLNTIPAPPSMYGSAYDNISEGGPYLWIFTGTSTGAPCQVEQYDLNTLTLTGVTHSVSGDFPGTIAGGLFTSGDVVPGTWVLGGLAQGTPDILFGYELCPFETWLKIEPTSGGPIPPGGSEEVTATFNSLDFPFGTVKTANIHFIPNAGIEDIVFAKLTAGNPITGTLDGTVTEAGTGVPIEGVLVTATPAKESTYTNSDGYYIFEDLGIGTYNLTFEKEGYNVGLVEGVEIFEDDTTTVNYTMTSPELTYTPASFTFQTAPGGSVVDTLYVENIGTGPVDFDIDIEYIYDKSRQSILCVDRDGSSTTGYTDDWPYFQAALDAAGYSYTYYEVTDLTQDGPDLATMQLYDVIIWFSGEAWGYFGHDCMTDNDEINLAAYLDGGGTLFLSAQDYFWASYPSAGNFSAGQFPYDYLGMRSVSQDTWVIELPSTGSVEGVTGSLAEGYTFDIQDIYTTDKDGLFVDMVTAHEGQDLFKMTSPTPEGICGIQYDAMTFRTVFTTASFAAITDPAVQTNLIDAIIQWLSSGIPSWLTVVPGDGTIDPSTIAPLTVTANSEGLENNTPYNAVIHVNTANPDIGATDISVTFTVVPDAVGTGETPPTVTKLNSNFPNPFGHSTTISFSLKAKSHVKLSVYNMRGQLVATLIDEEMNPANHTVVWNGRNGNVKLANGIYFYKLEADKKTFIKKMLLMR